MSSPPDRRTAALLAEGALVLGMVLLGLGWLFHPMGSHLQRIMGDFGDSRLINYVLEHSYLWLRQVPPHQHYWDLPIFFPVHNVSAYSDTLLGVAPLYWLWRLLGIAADSSYQLWMLTMAGLNFAAAWALCRLGLRLPPLAAAGGAFLFAFAGARGAQLNHPQLLPHAYTALAALALVRAVELGVDRRARKWIALAAAAVVGQLYSGFYLGWFLVLALSVLVALALVWPRYRRLVVPPLGTHAVTLAVAGALAGLALLPLARHSLEAARTLGLRRFEDITPMIPRPASWLYMGTGSWLYGWQHGHAPWSGLEVAHEHALGLGLVTMVCCALGLWAARQRPWTPLLAAAVGVLVATATWWPGGWTPWRLVFAGFPGGGAIRAVSRIGLVLLLPAALGLTYFLAGILAGSVAGRSRRIGVAVAVLLLVAAEQGYTMAAYDKQASRDRVAWLTRRIDRRCPAFFFLAVQTQASSGLPWMYHMDAVLAQMRSGIPTVNGYAGNFPDGFLHDLWGNVPSAAQVHLFDARLERWRTRWGLGSRDVCVIAEPVPF